MITNLTLSSNTTISELTEQLKSSQQETLNLQEKCNTESQLNESKNYQKVMNNYDTIDKNYRLMNIKLLDIPAQTATKIRGIMEQPVPELNRAEFQRLFYEDKMWAIMRNLPEWLTNTWLSLNAFAKQTHK